MKTYHLTPAGRRLTLTLMVGAFALWIFAFAVLRSTLNLSYRHPFSSTLAALRQGLGAGQVIPAAILLVMIVAVPLLLWSLWEEWSTSYTVADDGLHYRTTRGITVKYAWSSIEAIRPAEADGLPETVVVREDARRQIRNPLLRWLHSQAFGMHTIPIYRGVEDREELLAEIARRSTMST